MFNFNSATPNPNFCIRCNTEMVRADNEEKIKLYKYGLILRKSTEATYYVCPNCGYVEMKVDNPSIFKQKK